MRENSFFPHTDQPRPVNNLLFSFAANGADKVLDRGPYCKKLDRFKNARVANQIKGLRYWPAEMLQRKIKMVTEPTVLARP